jgi:predicted acyltransferase
MEKQTGRLLSLDVMRGIIMILLAAESCHVYESIKEWHDGSLITQFFHHPWHGLRFWDLVQPSFMFMAGTAMYISYARKQEKGSSWAQNFKHIAIRSLKLFLLGTGLHCVYAGKLVWELWNVLTQLSVTGIIAYLVIGRSFSFQITTGFLLLILNDVLYRTILVPGFDQPFVEYHNFGAYMDTLLMGKINPDGWVAINIIPTAAHTIWGVVAGKLFLTPMDSTLKTGILAIAGAVLLCLGFGADISGLSPIIKRISTAGFVLASAGWVLLILSVLYWWIDVKNHQRYTWIAGVVGMNAIFIYLFFETVGMQWLNGVVDIFMPVGIVSALGALVLEWYLCYWLYQKKIFFKL